MSTLHIALSACRTRENCPSRQQKVPFITVHVVITDVKYDQLCVMLLQLRGLSSSTPMDSSASAPETASTAGDNTFSLEFAAHYASDSEDASKGAYGGNGTRADYGDGADADAHAAKNDGEGDTPWYKTDWILALLGIGVGLVAIWVSIVIAMTQFVAAHCVAGDPRPQ